MHAVQRCSLLLLMFHGLCECVCVCVCVCVLDTNVSCAKTAEPVGMSFQMWTRVVPRNHAFSGVQTPPREGAIELGTCHSPVRSI